MEIINRILLIMEQKHIRLIDLANHLGLPHGSVSYWKNKQSDPPAKFIPKIASLLGVTTNFLLTGENDKAETTYFTGPISKRDKDFVKLYMDLPDEDKEYLIKALQKAKQTNL